jgi:hypothetical protein
MRSASDTPTCPPHPCPCPAHEGVRTVPVVCVCAVLVGTSGYPVATELRCLCSLAQLGAVLSCAGQHTGAQWCSPMQEETEVPTAPCGST